MTASEIAKTFEDCAIDHGPDGWPAVQQKELSEAAAMLRKQADRIEQLETALSECRDSITPPAPGAATESTWNEAMQMPLAVPAYVKENMARLERENAELFKDAERLNFACEVYEKDIKFLKNENAELRKDTERLDFYAANTRKIQEVIGTWYHREGHGKMARKAPSFRAAIDAAMQKEPS